jgi:hypothetical protein
MPVPTTGGSFLTVRQLVLGLRTYSERETRTPVWLLAGDTPDDSGVGWLTDAQRAGGDAHAVVGGPGRRRKLSVLSQHDGLQVFRSNPVTPAKSIAVNAQEVNLSKGSAMVSQLVASERMVQSEVVAPNVGTSADRV